MNNIYDIWFSRVKISNSIKLRLYEKYPLEKLFYFSEEEYSKLGLKEITIKNLLSKEFRNNLEDYKRVLDKNKIYLIFKNEERYPEKLKVIEDLPCFIFARGNLNLLYEDSVGIIGSRNASNYGKKVAFETAKELSNLNINTVSGLANGVDTFAHLGSLKGKYGKTIAVLANGLLESDIYPKGNLVLFNKIINEGGLAVSEQIIGTKAENYMFPIRNRIVAGLSDKILVTEASIKSGTSITVRLCTRTRKRYIFSSWKYL